MGMMNNVLTAVVPQMIKAIEQSNNPNKSQAQNGDVQSKSASASGDQQDATSNATNQSKDASQLLASGSNDESSLGGGSRNKGVDPSQLALSKTTLLGG